MQCLLVFVYACAVMALVKGGVVDTQSGAGGASSEEARPCPDHVDQAMECLIDPEANQRFQNFTSVEEFRQYFHHYCQEAPAKRHCLSEVTATWQRCANQSQNQGYPMFVGICETALNVSCADDGQHLANVYHAFDGPNSLEDFFGQCLENVDLKFKKEKEANLVLDQGERVLLFYRRLNDLKMCLITNVQVNEDLKTSIVTLLDGIRHGLTCIHPMLQTLVPCSDIDKN